jgi:hypothetical protein
LLDSRVERLFTNSFYEGVATLEAMAAEGEAELGNAWSGDQVSSLGQRLMPDCACLSVWRVLSRADIVGLLDSVRNRVQLFVLELEAENPEADAPGAGEAVSAERVTQIFQTTIYGEGHQVAISGRDLVQSGGTVVTKGDRPALLSALREAGVEGELLDELEAALDEESPEGVMGPKVGRWLRTATGGGCEPHHHGRPELLGRGLTTSPARVEGRGLISPPTGGAGTGSIPGQSGPRMPFDAPVCRVAHRGATMSLCRENAAAPRRSRAPDRRRF